jgi:hypothetical protein
MIDLDHDPIYILEPADLARAAALDPFVADDCTRLTVAAAVAAADRAIVRSDLAACVLWQRHIGSRRRDDPARIAAVLDRLATAIALALGLIEQLPEQAVAA